MEPRIAQIRQAERLYHEQCYDQYKLFESGSWLHRPVKTVMDTLARFEGAEGLQVLDLGCGVGRNSIPIAQAVQARGGRVVCVDLLQAALDKLQAYSEPLGVSACIEPRLSDIGTFGIAEREYDFIVAVSSLEHVESERVLGEVLHRMADGTRDGGINCLIMGTQIREVDVASDASRDPMIEVNLPTERAEQALAEAFAGWEVLLHTVRPLQFDIEREGRDVSLSCDCLTYVVRRSAET
ncbi:class I SAM-dependent methyltransferase [Paenibacillus sp. HJGM_3]|uniref:class I SAM-dependent methyltransferase n=1 Tax=Paenibacillus sp. HJGM_3 TaxID=3379816 RepID=UPI00385F7549